jgi:uncharacterized membrane protein YhaH (DUF805 family)
MKWYLKVMSQYADFSGRARRTEYWMFSLFNIIFGLIAAIVDQSTGLIFENQQYGLFSSLYALAVFIPGLAVAVRRLHDTGRSGKYIFLAFVPLAAVMLLMAVTLLIQDAETQRFLLRNSAFVLIISTMIISIWLFVLFLLPGTSGDNQYGPDPKEESLS